MKAVRHVKVHVFIALLVSSGLEIPRATALYLNPAACFLLDVLDISAAMSDDLGAQVEPWDGFEINRHLFDPPFSLSHCQHHSFISKPSSLEATHATKLIFLNWFLVSTTETTIVHELWEVLLDKLFDLLDSQLQAFLGGACNVKIERRVLYWLAES